MKYGNISSRRCKRCGKVAVAPHPTYPQTTGPNAVQIPLCPGCADWNNKNTDKAIQ